MFVALGAEIIEREGSRIAVVLFDEVRVFHRPHPSPDTDKGAVKLVKEWLFAHGISPINRNDNTDTEDNGANDEQINH